MKILFISNLYPPNVVGGYERLCFAVARNLAARGHEVAVLTSTYGGATEDYPDQKIWRTLRILANRNSIYEPFEASEAERADINISNIEEFSRVVEEFEPDSIFAWNLYFYDISLLHAIEGNGRYPVNYFLTDNWLINFFNPDFLGRYFRNNVFANGGDDVVASAPAIMSGRALFGSAYVRALYEEAGLTFQQTEVIHNGVTLPTHTEETYRDRFLSIRHGEYRLLFAGRVTDVKGVHVLVEAVAKLRSMIPGVRIALDIVGECTDRAYRAKLDASIEELGLGKMISFLEPVSEARLFSLFQDYDAYIFPSLYEPFALTLILALHAGIPTIASDAGGNVEIIHDNVTGLRYRKHDADELATCLKTLWRRPMLRSMISRRAREISYQFTFERMIDRIEEVLATPIAAGNSGDQSRRTLADAGFA